MTPDQVKGQHGTTETIKVRADNEQGYAVINAEDFDKSVHTRYAESAGGEGGTKRGAKA